jgi:hypothetical protein
VPQKPCETLVAGIDKNGGSCLPSKALHSIGIVKKVLWGISGGHAAAYGGEVRLERRSRLAEAVVRSSCVPRFASATLE